MNLTKEDYIILRRLMFKLLRRNLKESEATVVYKMQHIISEKLKELTIDSNITVNFPIQNK